MEYTPSTIARYLKKDRQCFFLMELDFDGWKHRISTSDIQVENADGDPLSFQGLIKNRFNVGSSFDFRSFRYSVPSITIDIINTARFQDRETRHKIDAGTARIWLWSPSLDWTDIEDYPIFAGSIQRAGGSLSDSYRFNLVDFSANRGMAISAMSMANQHPADILAALMSGWTTLDTAQIGYASLETLRAVLAGWIFTSTVDSSADAFDIIDRVARQCWCARGQKDGKVSVVTFDVNGPAVADLRDQDFIDPAGVVFDATPWDYIANNVEASYGYSGGAFGSTLNVNASNNALCAHSDADYGTQAQATISLGDINRTSMALGSMNRYFEFFAFRHNLFRCAVPYWQGFDLYEGDVALITHADGPSIDGAGWQQERCILLDRLFKNYGVAQSWWKIAP